MSSTKYGRDEAWTQRFSDGEQFHELRKIGINALRCVRG